MDKKWYDTQYLVNDKKRVPDYPVAIVCIALGAVTGMLISLIKLAY